MGFYEGVDAHLAGDDECIEVLAITQLCSNHIINDGDIGVRGNISCLSPGEYHTGVVVTTIVTPTINETISLPKYEAIYAGLIAKTTMKVLMVETQKSTHWMIMNLLQNQMHQRHN